MPDILIQPGLVEDTRSQIDKDKDYVHEEVAPMAVALKWNRGIEGAPKYSIRNQDGSGSCVGQAIAKAIEAINGVVQSAHPVYRRRRNYPQIGMWLQDGGDIIKHLGTTTEQLDQSQNMNEPQMNRDLTVETPLTLPLYVFANVGNIDSIATAIELYKHCVITINGNLQEYAYSEKPIVNPGSELNCAHAICGVYYFTDTKGEKCILIDESWGPAYITRRVLTESYLKARGTGAMYFVKPITPPTPVKPKFHFTVPLNFGMMGSLGVKNLQDILKYEGLMDIKVFSTGNYLQITTKAVLAFQRKYKVAPESELITLNGMRVGAKTIKKLNELYS
jgi:hypothetical protein